MKDDRLYLTHIKERIEYIQEYTAQGGDVFFRDRKTQDAVLRNLHTLSESVQRLSEPLKAKHPEVDWRTISAFRNVMVHDYLGIDLDQVWDIVQDDLPGLKQSVEAILADPG
ncbi:MAG: DUF86 domain-containing protein [Anaerolineales bacterium]|nr:DUF86 domain-containing protein [Anaerolineales bacterium]